MNEVKIFNNPQFGEIRTAGTSSNPLFCLADVCKALDLQSSAVMRRLEDGVISNHPVTDNLGRQQVANFVNEDGLYDVILDSRKPEARQFRKWVTSDVLPSIRKTGGYIATTQEDTPELIMARALQVAQATIEKHNSRILQLEAENAEKNKAMEQAEEQVIQLSDTVASMKPKVDYCDIILQSKETVATTQIAQDYGMTAKAFNILLRNFGIQHKVAGQWILYAPYLPLGYVQSESIPITHTDGRKTTKLFSKWTQKGRLFLYEELKKNNVLPLIERKEKVA
nr:MAG TPA: repressor domain protein [Caudoviricetes sp.]